MNRINTKKSAAILLTIVLAISLFGCSSNSKTDTSAKPADTADATTTAAPSKAPVTLKIFAEWMIKPINESIPTDPVMTEIKKQTGVTLDFSPFMGGGDAAAKISTLLAGNELPDIILTSDSNLVNKLIASKKALPLDDLLKSNGPDITKNYQPALDHMKVVYPNADNKSYFVKARINGDDSDPTHTNNMWDVRWDLYKKLGKPKVDTLDQYLEVLKQMQQLEPKNKEGKPNYGMGLNFGDNWGWLLITKAPANGQGMVETGKPLIFRDVEKDELTPKLTEPDNVFWQAMKFYNKAYQAGVLDPESITMKFQNVTDKATTGRYLSQPAAWFLGDAEATFIKEGTPEKGYVPLPVWTKPQNTYLYAKNDIGNQYFWLISASSKHPERAMDLFNYLATFDAQELINNGPQGIAWDMVNGKPALKPDMIQLSKTDPLKYIAQTGTSTWYHLSINGENDDPRGWKTNFYNDPEVLKANLKAFQKDFIQDMGYAYPSEGIDKLPNHIQIFSLQDSISLETGSDLAAKEASINTYIGTAAPALIFAKTDADFESGKVKLISELKKMGADEVFKFYHDKYEQIKKK